MFRRYFTPSLTSNTTCLTPKLCQTSVTEETLMKVTRLMSEIKNFRPDLKSPIDNRTCSEPEPD